MELMMIIEGSGLFVHCWRESQHFIFDAVSACKKLSSIVYCSCHLEPLPTVTYATVMVHVHVIKATLVGHQSTVMLGVLDYWELFDENAFVDTMTLETYRWLAVCRSHELINQNTNRKMIDQYG